MPGYCRSFVWCNWPSFSIHESNVLCCARMDEMHAQPSNVCGCRIAFTHPPSRTDLSVCRSNVHRSKVSFVSLLVMTNTIFCSSPRTSQSAQQQHKWRLMLIFEAFLLWHVEYHTRHLLEHCAQVVSKASVSRNHDA